MRLYQAGDWGYAQFRIPCLLATSAGALLALCEARSNPRSDSGQICILLRMSLDGGQSWSQPRIVAEDAGNTVGTPCLVEHLPSGTLQLIFNGNDGAVSEADILAGRGCRRVLRMESSDGGQRSPGPAGPGTPAAPAMAFACPEAGWLSPATMAIPRRSLARARPIRGI